MKRKSVASSSHRQQKTAEEVPNERHDRVASWAWGGLFLAAAFLLGCVEMADTDIWWHIRTGQLIFERGKIPQHDWFTYTNPESPWIDLHWGFQLGVASLYALGGVAALVLAKSVVGTLTFAVSLAAQPARWPMWQAAACLLPSLLLFAGRYYVRPEMLSLFFLACTLHLLFYAHSHPRRLWWLLLIQLAWINTHALFVLGQAIWWMFLADAAWRSWGPAKFRTWGAADEELTPPRWKMWSVLTVLQPAVCLLNPYGWRGLMFPVTLWTRISGSQRDFYRQLAGEFSGMSEYLQRYGLQGLWSNLSALMLTVLLLGGTISFVLLARQRRVSVWRLLLFVSFGYLAWQANRNGVLFAIVGGMVLRWNVGEWLELGGVHAAGPLIAGKQNSLQWAKMGVAVALTMLVLSIPSNVYSYAFRPLPAYPVRPRWFGWNVAPHWYTFGSVAYLGQPDMPKNCYASHLGHASLYLFAHGPQRRVFADPRLEVNTPETLAAYLRLKQLLVTHNPQAEVLLKASLPAADWPALMLDLSEIEEVHEALLHHPRWRPVYYDDVTLVLLHVDLLAKHPQEIPDLAPLLEHWKMLRALRERRQR